MVFTQRLRQTLLLASWVPVVFFVQDHLCWVCPVNGISMRPTFNPDTNLLWRDWVILDKLGFRDLKAWWAGHPESLFKVGDVVVLRSPLDPGKILTKRIVGLGGDTVVTRKPYPSSYVEIPPGHAWLEGDEQFHSTDSNTYGPVSLTLIEAKVKGIIWPRWSGVSSGGREARVDPRFIHDTQLKT
ncbi:LexA/Signal peptidase [Saitoella complicata NRRL Y-17804]|nr:LexA/Signal peptidase [Saitoella complicata NRRL Y-17804]ODQ54457.1 LexA/Signal peptidase [Saitoella complicata NRRL Y-17804]